MLDSGSTINVGDCDMELAIPLLFAVELVSVPAVEVAENGE